MIFGKINPPVKIAQQINNFSFTEITGSYICATTNKYTLGADVARFEIMFGELNEDSFQVVTRTSNLVSGETINQWGTDDSVILAKLAELNGTTVTEIVTSSINDINRF